MAVWNIVAFHNEGEGCANITLLYGGDIDQKVKFWRYVIC